MGSVLGVMKTAAARIGVSAEEYQAHVAANEKWCGGCKTWHDRADFAVDRSRGDGLMSKCRAYISAKSRAAYSPKPRRERGRRYVDARDGDKEQARRRVNYLVEADLLSPPNDVPCADCGHIWTEGERRHEYDHYLGYGAEHHEDVEAVCTTCHRRREAARASGSRTLGEFPERAA